MEFLNLTQLIQVFANEYISPKNKVLLIKNGFDDFKFIFNFIGCEMYCINVYQEILPFEDNFFNVIIDLNGNIKNFKEIVILKKVKNSFYTIINGQTEIFGTIPFTK